MHFILEKQIGLSKQHSDSRIFEVETVIPFSASNFTPLKQGVNEKLAIETKAIVAKTP